MTKLSYYEIETDKEKCLYYGCNRNEIISIVKSLNIVCKDIKELSSEFVKINYTEEQKIKAREISKKYWNHKEITIKKNNSSKMVLLSL
jgi:phenylalanyl-tRNA synthetase alpha subunit